MVEFDRLAIQEGMVVDEAPGSLVVKDSSLFLVRDLSFERQFPS